MATVRLQNRTGRRVTDGEVVRIYPGTTDGFIVAKLTEFGIIGTVSGTILIGQVGYINLINTVDYSKIAGTPTSFTPKSHKHLFSDVEEVPDFLKVDQTTPQTITGGLLQYSPDHVEFTENHQIVDKEYVDQAITGLNQHFYNTDDIDGDTGYFLTQIEPYTDIGDSTTVAGLIEGQLIATWISPVGVEFPKMLAGLYVWEIYAEKTAGTRTLRVYWDLIERKADTSEHVVAMSAYSKIITAKERLRVTLALPNDFPLEAGSRILGRVRANVTGTGNDPTAVLYYGQLHPSHWETPSNIEILSGIFISNTFETVSVNLKNYPYALVYGVDGLDAITYDLGGGLSIVKTFNYTLSVLTSIVLSGDTPSGIDLTKTLHYTGDDLISVVYS